MPVFISMASERPAIVTSGAGRHDWLAQTHRIAIRRRRCVCMWGGGGVHAFARVRAHACAFVRACVCVCLRACVMCLQYTIITFDTG